MRVYERGTDTPGINTRLAELFDHAYSTLGLFSALGSYWTEYYADSESLANAVTGHVVAVSQQYREILNNILRSNILDIPSRDKQQMELLVFSEEDAIILDHNVVFRDTGVITASYLASSLFEPEIVLERDVDYTINEDTGTIVFNVDIFNDSTITNSTSRFDVYPNRKILFWACDIVLSSEWIYERYGRFLYNRDADSIAYKWVIQALMYFYVHNKSVTNIQDVLNIMYGVPFSQKEGEVVESIYEVEPSDAVAEETDDSKYTVIQTTFRKYYVYPGAEVMVSVGDTLTRFQILAAFHKVEDYITDPDFWENAPFPDELIDGDASELSAEFKEELLDKVLKYNMVYVNLMETYQTRDTYNQQLGAVLELLKDSIPVYLFPVIGTTFRVFFQDEVIDDENRNLDTNTFDQHDYLLMTAHPTFIEHVPDDRRTYSGELDYSGGPRTTFDDIKDYGSYSEDFEPYLFSGKLRYGSPYKDARRVHRPFNNAHIFDGTWDYSHEFTYLHTGSNDEFSITGVNFKHIDAYVFSDMSVLTFRCCNYDGETNYDNDLEDEDSQQIWGTEGHYVFSANFMNTKELALGLDGSFVDTLDTMDDDSFTITEISSS